MTSVTPLIASLYVNDDHDRKTGNVITFSMLRITDNSVQIERGPICLQAF